MSTSGTDSLSVSEESGAPSAARRPDVSVDDEKLESQRKEVTGHKSQDNSDKDLIRRQLEVVDDTSPNEHKRIGLVERAVMGIALAVDGVAMIQGVGGSDLLESLEGKEKDKAAKYDFAQSRASAFERLPMMDALAQHPELDGAYKQLAQAGNRAEDVAATREMLIRELRQGNLPRADVTREESLQVIEHAAAHRNLMVTDASHLDSHISGEVVANTSHHTLIKLSEMVAVRYDKSALLRDLQIGEHVTLQKTHGQIQINDQVKTQDKQLQRSDMQLEHEHTFGSPAGGHP
jgi:hypothetical protein